MLYTVVDTHKIWADEKQTVLPELQRVPWNGIDLMVGKDGRINDVISSDPVVFLQLYKIHPAGGFVKPFGRG
jgi:hypothetical protein